MAVQTVNQLKQWFQTRDKPTQQQFWDWLDSFVHRNEGIAIENVSGLTEILQGKVDVATLDQYAQLSDIMLMVDLLADLVNYSKDDCRFILVRDTAILAALQTDDLPNNITTFASSMAGWLWETVLTPGGGGGGGELSADRFTINADHVYTLLSGWSIDKIKMKPTGAQTLKAGTTDGGEEVMFEETLAGDVWKTVTIDVDANGADVPVYIVGATDLVNVIIYKRLL